MNAMGWGAVEDASVLHCVLERVGAMKNGGYVFPTKATPVNFRCRSLLHAASTVSVAWYEVTTVMRNRKSIHALCRRAARLRAPGSSCTCAGTLPRIFCQNICKLSPFKVSGGSYIRIRARAAGSILLALIRFPNDAHQPLTFAYLHILSTYAYVAGNPRT